MPEGPGKTATWSHHLDHLPLLGRWGLRFRVGSEGRVDAASVPPEG